MRKLLVQGEEEFIITIPDDSRVTFGPWSPPGMATTKSYGMPTDRQGTLRVYKGAKSTENVIAVFGGVRGFRDLDMEYERITTTPITTATTEVKKEIVDWGDLEEDEKEELADLMMKRALNKATGTEF